MIWIYTLLSVLFVTIISLIGILTLSLKRVILQKILLYIVSFATGALFGSAFIHLIPESFRTFGTSIIPSTLILSGILMFFVIEKFIRWRHCHIPTSKQHQHPLALMNLIGDAVHNFTDGMIIAATYLVSLPLGITTTIAVILHEIPQEIGDFGILLYAGLTVRKALLYNYISATTAIAGAVITLIIGQQIQSLSSALIPIAAGGFIYIAGSDLIPELHTKCMQNKSAHLIQFILLILGIAVMGAMLFLE